MFSLSNGLLFDQLDALQLCAVIEEGRLVDLWTADNNFFGLGSVHLARVTGRMNRAQTRKAVISCPKINQSTPFNDRTQLRVIKPVKKQTIIQAEHNQIPRPEAGQQPFAYPDQQYWNMSLLSY